MEEVELALEALLEAIANRTENTDKATFNAGDYRVALTGNGEVVSLTRR